MWCENIYAYVPCAVLYKGKFSQNLFPSSSSSLENDKVCILFPFIYYLKYSYTDSHNFSKKAQ